MNAMESLQAYDFDRYCNHHIHIVMLILQCLQLRAHWQHLGVASTSSCGNINLLKKSWLHRQIASMLQGKQKCAAGKKLRKIHSRYSVRQLRDSNIVGQARLLNTQRCVIVNLHDGWRAAKSGAKEQCVKNLINNNQNLILDELQDSKV